MMASVRMPVQAAGRAGGHASARMPCAQHLRAAATGPDRHAGALRGRELRHRAAAAPARGRLPCAEEPYSAAAAAAARCPRGQQPCGGPCLRLLAAERDWRAIDLLAGAAQPCRRRNRGHPRWACMLHQRCFCRMLLRACNLHPASAWTQYIRLGCFSSCRRGCSGA